MSRMDKSRETENRGVAARGGEWEAGVTGTGDSVSFRGDKHYLKLTVRMGIRLL